MFNGKLYCVWTNHEMSPVLSVYRDDTEALIAFRNLITRIRDDILSGVLDPDTDNALTLYCHGAFIDDVIYGFTEPVFVCDGCDVLSESDCETVSPIDPYGVFPVDESEVSE